eukprot:maker-scaffold225_size250570-snap-gene-0.7 protein:Tk01781 transcript:maker-scaffold225_size250570-snap-gene-0.7-mRNA-1 annotation:"hypothetical protein DAPPUDRAFT_228781"
MGLNWGVHASAGRRSPGLDPSEEEGAWVAKWASADGTALESLLNLCQKWLEMASPTTDPLKKHQQHQIDEDLRSSWLNFLRFMAELYGMFKRKHNSPMLKDEQPKHAKGCVLSILVRALIITLESILFCQTGRNSKHCPNQPTFQEQNQAFQVVFHLLTSTSLGLELSSEWRPKMEQIAALLRDLLLHSSIPSGSTRCSLGFPGQEIGSVELESLRKSVLQLIEMQAAGWQLPASAMTYYYHRNSLC